MLANENKEAQAISLNYSMNKKLIWIVVALLIIGGAVFYFYKNNERISNSSEAVEIGAVLPLSGNGAQYGQYFKQGSELALSDALDEGLIKPNQVKLIIEDGKGDANLSLTAFRKLTETDHIDASLIDVSSVILAIKPEANKDSVVLFNPSAFSSEIEDSNDFVFSVLPNASIYGKFIGNYCFSNLNMKSAGVLYRNDAMGVSFNNSFKNSFGELGGKVVFEESHKTGETDFRTIIEKMRSQNVDMVFVASFAPEIANFAKQARELNYKVQIVTYQGFFIREALKIAQESANGIICIASTFDPSSNDPRIASLRDKLKAKYNTDDLNYYLAAHYDATRILLEAIAAGSKTGREIKNYIDNKKSFNGLTGQISFDERGLATIPLQAYRVENMQFVPMK